MSRVFILGGTGFIGEKVLEQLAEDNIPTLVLTRKSKPIESHSIQYLNGDAANIEISKAQIQDFKPDTFIYLIGLIREFPKQGLLFEDYHYKWAKHAINLAKSLGTKKFIYMSANGVDAGISQYQTTKLKAENYLKQSGLDYVILRPSIVIGNSDKYSFKQVLNQFTRFFVTPEFIGVDIKLAPLSRDDLALAIIKAIQLKPSQTLQLCGPKTYSLSELLHEYVQQNQKKILFVPIPFKFITFLAHIFGRFRFFPASVDQLRMLEEDNICTNNSNWDKLQISPTHIKAVL